MVSANAAPFTSTVVGLFNSFLTPSRSQFLRREATRTVLKEIKCYRWIREFSWPLLTNGDIPMESIFVALASYRDPEYTKTLEDLFGKAHHPQRVFVGLCFQYVPGDRYSPARVPHQQTRCLSYDARTSLGACWAKSEAQSLWNGEDYVLNIDSHMRFSHGWDVLMIETLRECGVPLPVLSTYPASYTPPDHKVPATPLMVPLRFDEQSGILMFQGIHAHMDAPRRGAYISGNFFFATGAFLEQLPYDPQLYFFGEEVTMSVRAWTHGWDVFCPHRCLIYHQYCRAGQPRHWDDHHDWQTRQVVAESRVNQLLQGRCHDRHGLGVQRQVADFETFAGISFARREIQPRALRGELG